MATQPTGTVTFLFTDIEGSTKLWEHHPEAMRTALARHDSILQQGIESSGGYVFKTVGDAFYAAFTTATDALAAALTIQYALANEVWGETGPLRVRAALHTGAVESRNGDYFGHTLSRVARILSAGHGGQMLLSAATWQLVRDHPPSEVMFRDLGVHHLKSLPRAEQIFQVITPDLPFDFPPLVSLSRPLPNLPAQPTKLIGRELEIQTICGLLRRTDERLITLTGPGGTGKTRLALQIANELSDDFRDGVFLVALAPISDVNLVATTIAQTFGLKEEGNRPLIDTLKDYLCEKHTFLLLDNFEQVTPAAPLLSTLLQAAPQLKIMVTSREVLHLSGERECVVPPLGLPDLKQLPLLDQLTQYGAVRLFVERAQAVKADFALTQANVITVAEICHRLDGLPLAIELAAVRVKVFLPQALLARLDHRLKVLTTGTRDLPARHQTMRRTIDWSYDLLDAKEQILFARLGVFAGGCTVDAVEAVCYLDNDQPIDCMDGIISLVDKSLLRTEADETGEPRFFMLETVREYALERLAASGAEDAIRRQYAYYYLALAELAEQSLTGPDQIVWLDRLEQEQENLRSVLTWGRDIEDATETRLRMAGALWSFWWQRGYLTEGRVWLADVLAQARTQEPTVRHAKAFIGAGYLSRIQGDSAEAQVHFEQSLSIGRMVHDKHIIAEALSGLGDLARAQGNQTQAQVLLEESIALFQELEDKPGLALALCHLGLVAMYQGNYTIADTHLEAGVMLWRAIGDKAGLASALRNLGWAAQQRGDTIRAIALAEESLILSRELGDKRGSAAALATLGWVVLEQGDVARAIVLQTESLAIARELSSKIGIALALNSLGELARAQGDYEQAFAFYEQSLVLYQNMGAKHSIAMVLCNLGYVARHRGDLAVAVRYLKESLALSVEEGDRDGSITCLSGLAGIMSAYGQSEYAVRLCAVVETGLHVHNLRLQSAEHADFMNTIATARIQLNETEFAEAWAEGRMMPLEQAITTVLDYKVPAS